MTCTSALRLRILKTGYKIGQRLPQFANIFRGLGQIIGEIYFRISQATQLVNRDLKAVLVFVDQPFDFQEVVLLEGVESLLDVVPHLGFDLAAAVAQSQREVRLTGFLWFDLLGDDYEAGSDDLIFVITAFG